MALSAGTRLGSYEIFAPIGAGGMREVWRARDTLAGLEPGDVPMRFTGDGSALFCARVGMNAADILRLDLSNHERSVWKTIHPREPAGVFALFPSDVTPDGRRYLYTYGRLLSDLYLVEGLQ